MILTVHERKLVKSSWLILKSEAGVSNQLIFYEAFFKVAPEAKKYFSKKKGNDIDFAKLSKKFSYTMDFIIDNIDDLEKIPDQISDLGSTHKKLNIESKYYLLFNQSILALIDELLGSRASEEVKTAWKKVLEYITEKMKAAPIKRSNKFRDLLIRLFGKH